MWLSLPNNNLKVLNCYKREMIKCVLKTLMSRSNCFHTQINDIAITLKTYFSFQIYFDGKKNSQAASPLAELKERAKTEPVRAEVVKICDSNLGPNWRAISMFVGSSQAPAHTELVSTYNFVPHDTSLRYVHSNKFIWPLFMHYCEHLKTGLSRIQIMRNCSFVKWSGFQVMTWLPEILSGFWMALASTIWNPDFFVRFFRSLSPFEKRTTKSPVFRGF
jgi:hypothetical protein